MISGLLITESLEDCGKSVCDCLAVCGKRMTDHYLIRATGINMTQDMTQEPSEEPLVPSSALEP